MLIPDTRRLYREILSNKCVRTGRYERLALSYRVTRSKKSVSANERGALPIHQTDFQKPLLAVGPPLMSNLGE